MNQSNKLLMVLLALETSVMQFHAMSDLVSNCLLEVELPALLAKPNSAGVKWVGNVGERLIEEVEVEIIGPT